VLIFQHSGPSVVDKTSTWEIPPELLGTGIQDCCQGSWESPVMLFALPSPPHTDAASTYGKLGYLSRWTASHCSFRTEHVLMLAAHLQKLWNTGLWLRFGALVTLAR
jgi:hypothetical protein